MKEPAKQFAIAPLNVRVVNASLDLAQALPISIDAVINGHAPFKAEGTVTPEPLAAQLDVSLAKARMTILQPYVLPLADLTIKAGELGLKGKVRLDPPDAPGPDLSFDGDVTIDGFKSVDNALGKDLVNFRQVALGKLSVAMGPDAVSIDTITVSEPFARVIISPERVINIAAVLDPKGTAAALEARRAAGGGRGENDSGRQASPGQGTREGRVAGRKGPQGIGWCSRPALHRRRCRPKACRSGSAKCGSTTGPWISPTSSCSRTSRRRSCGSSGTLTGLSSDAGCRTRRWT